MRVIENTDKRITITCNCGVSLEIGIEDIQVERKFLMDSCYVKCPKCGRRKLLRSDIREVIANQ